MPDPNPNYKARRIYDNPNGPIPRPLPADHFQADMIPEEERKAADDRAAAAAKAAAKPDKADAKASGDSAKKE